MPNNKERFKPLRNKQRYRYTPSYQRRRFKRLIKKKRGRGYIGFNNYFKYFFWCTRSKNFDRLDFVKRYLQPLKHLRSCASNNNLELLFFFINKSLKVHSYNISKKRLSKRKGLSFFTISRRKRRGYYSSFYEQRLDFYMINRIMQFWLNSHKKFDLQVNRLKGDYYYKDRGIEGLSSDDSLVLEHGSSSKVRYNDRRKKVCIQGNRPWSYKLKDDYMFRSLITKFSLGFSGESKSIVNRRLIVLKHLKIERIIVDMLISVVMRNGKKQRAIKILNRLLLLLRNNASQIRRASGRKRVITYYQPLNRIINAVFKVSPLIYIRKKRVGRVVYGLPFRLNNPRTSWSFGVRWLVHYARQRRGRAGNLAYRLFEEIEDIHRGCGGAYGRKINIYKIGIRNKAFRYLLARKKRKKASVLRRFFKKGVRRS